MVTYNQYDDFAELFTWQVMITIHFRTWSCLMMVVSFSQKYSSKNTLAESCFLAVHIKSKTDTWLHKILIR